MLKLSSSCIEFCLLEKLRSHCIIILIDVKILKALLDLQTMHHSSSVSVLLRFCLQDNGFVLITFPNEDYSIFLGLDFVHALFHHNIRPLVFRS